MTKGKAPRQNGALSQSMDQESAGGLLLVAAAAAALIASNTPGLAQLELSPASLVAPLPLAIALGLIVGKPLGILAAVSIAVGTGIAKLPVGGLWWSMLGIACLAGTGFTMSLFIGAPAFTETYYLTQVRLGVICGSLVSATLGYFILRYTRTRKF